MGKRVLDSQMSDETRDILERALASPAGLRVTMTGSTPEAAIKAAIRFRYKCNQLRVDDRKASLDILPLGDPKRGRSQFDILELRIEGATLIIEPRKPPPILDITEIPEVEIPQ